MDDLSRELTIKALPENIVSVTDWADSVLETAGCPIKIMRKINVVLDEVFSNIANYAYPGQTGSVTLRLLIPEDKSGMELICIDQGVAYDPLENEEPDLSLPAADRPIGGLGILLVKKLMDEVTYERIGEDNILKIRKSFL